MGNSFIEAMASGIPVIATPVGGITDFLKDGVTGLFCEVKNPESIAKGKRIFGKPSFARTDYYQCKEDGDGEIRLGHGGKRYEK